MAVSLINFPLRNIVNTTVAPTATSATILLPDTDARSIMLVNLGEETIFVRTGDVNVEANELSMPVLTGEKGVYSRGLGSPPATHIAFFAPSGTPTLAILQGEGI